MGWGVSKGKGRRSGVVMNVGGGGSSSSGDIGRIDHGLERIIWVIMLFHPLEGSGTAQG